MSFVAGTDLDRPVVVAINDILLQHVTPEASKRLGVDRVDDDGAELDAHVASLTSPGSVVDAVFVMIEPSRRGRSWLVEHRSRW